MTAAFSQPLIINLKQLKKHAKESASITGDLRLPTLDSFLFALADSNNKEDKFANVLKAINKKSKIRNASLQFKLSQTSKELIIDVNFISN